MSIIVNTGQWAARYVNARTVTLDMPENSTVADLVDKLNIPQAEAGLAVLKGRNVNKDYRLNDGDEITLHAIIIGG